MANSIQKIDRKTRLDISKQLTTEDLEELKYLCQDDIPAGVLQNIKTVLQLFNKIDEMDESGGHGIMTIAQLLEDIGKPNLRNKLLGIENKDHDSPVKHRFLIHVKIRVKVEDMLAGDWRRFGRYMGLEDYILDKFDAEPKNSTEKCHLALREWMFKEGQNATAENLKVILRDIKRFDVVNEIEKIEGNFETDSPTRVPEEQTSEKAEDLPYPKEVSEDDREDSVESTMASFTKLNLKSETDASKQQVRSKDSSSKFNVTVHPGSNVVVGDGTRMTVFSGGPMHDPKTVQQLLEMAEKVQNSKK